MPSSCADDLEISCRRARPWLGTIVEITATGAAPELLRSAIEAAFASIARVQRLMSFHEPTSDLSQLHRHAFQSRAAVDSWTHRVLAAGLEMAQASGGVFDFTVAPQLAEWGFLPSMETTASTLATWRDVELLPQNHVRFRRPLLLDLGGIAKGFAVDQAVETLQAAGVPKGLVNAGGDLRAFGDWECEVHLRHPSQPGQFGGSLQLHDQAAATSALYFSQKIHRGQTVSALVDGVTRQPLTQPASVTVIAGDAMMADALTKVVLVQGATAAPILQKYQASAIILSDDQPPVILGRTS